MIHPKSLGKYQITNVLGEGAMGVVYKGFDPDIQRVVALKTIRQSLADDVAGGAGISARFRNEAQAAGRLSHPGIVAVYDFGTQEDVAFIAMEFVEGLTLAHYLSHKVRFTDEDIPGLMTQLLDALHHAHEQGVWHRDIKPANIILGRNGRLKIADFGVARIENANLTQMHTLIGTPAYMAPEQFRGDTIDRRVDLYSAGVLLYTLLVGHPPFSGPTDSLMYKVVHETPPLPSQIDGVSRPRFYDALLALVLAKNPDQRPATAEDFKAALQRGVGEPIDVASWEQTIVRSGVPAAAQPGTPAHGSGHSGHSGQSGHSGHSGHSGVASSSHSSAPSHWDRAQLAAVEQSLAKHVGPMATVLVRRAARDCHDLGELYAKLAEQVTNPSARAAFLHHATASGVRPMNTTHGKATAANAAGPGQTAATLKLDLTAAVLEAARKLAAAQLGPIASVVVKTAAAKARDREHFCQTVADAAPEAARAKLLAELLRLF
jgi:eukaryotic-like serine/threonine-protein kinase